MAHAVFWRIMSIIIEDIEEILHKEGVGYSYYNECKLSGFSRNIQFWIKGVRFSIEWYNNRSKLSVGKSDFDIFIPFTSMESMPWACTSKRALLFEYNGIEVAQVPIERLEWMNKKIIHGGK